MIKLRLRELKDIQIFINLWWGYLPINPPLAENIVKSKCILYIEHTKHQSLVWLTLNMFRIGTLAYSWSKSSNTNSIYNKRLDSSYYVLSIILKMKTWIVVWIWYGCKWISEFTFLIVWLGTVAHHLYPASQSIWSHILLAREMSKIPNLKYGSYRMCWRGSRQHPFPSSPSQIWHFGMWIILNWRHLKPCGLKRNFWPSLNHTEKSKGGWGGLFQNKSYWQR